MYILMKNIKKDETRDNERLLENIKVYRQFDKNNFQKFIYIQIIRPPIS